MASSYQRTKRRTTWALTAILFVIFHAVLLGGPILGGYITAEQPVSQR
nr:hypothetical protein [Pseudomonas sp. UBA6718]